MSKKMSCGGFNIDNTTIKEEGGVLKATAAGLPDATGLANGKILMVSGGEWVVADIPSQLPAVTSGNAGEVLIVDSEGKWVAGTIG